MAHIQRRGPNRWRARYVDLDGYERSKTFSRKVDAERFLTKVEADKLRGDWVDPRRGQTLLSQWVEEYQRSRVDLQPTTRAQQEALLRTHILPAFGRRALASITEMQVRAFVSELVAKDLAPATVTKVLGTLSQAMRAAVRNRLITHNPCEGVVGPGDAPRGETVFLTPTQLNRLAEAIDDRFRAMLLLAGYRGLRFGEAAGMRVGRLDLVLGRLNVVEALKEVRGQLYLGPPKHGRVRTLSLPSFLVEALGQHLDAFPPKEDLVFTGRQGAMLRRSNFERKVWAPAVRDANVDPGLTFHGLRHTAVSIMIAEGASIVELAAVMGWARSTAVAMALRYGHLFAAREHQMNDALERVYRAAGRPGDGLGPETICDPKVTDGL